MTITRTINGEEREIVLTESEIYRAYLIQEHEYDKQDCELYLDEDGDTLMDLGITEEQFYMLLDDMAYEKRRNMDKYDMEWSYARDEAVRTVVYRFLKEQEEEK